MTIDFPQLIEAFAFASIAATNINHFSDADAYLSKAVSLNPTSWEIHLARGILEVAQNQPDLAINEFTAVKGVSNVPESMMPEVTSLISQIATTLTATTSADSPATNVPVATASAS